MSWDGADLSAKERAIPQTITRQMISPVMIPAVTVIVTVYNRTQYLRQAIQGALEQTFSSFEIIVTADSANEEIRAICESFQRPEIRYRRNPETLGVALNLRAAMSEARGKYIAVLNDDDLWLPEFLERLVAPLEADSNRVLAFSDHWVISQDGEIDQAQTERTSRHYQRDVLPEGEVAGFQEFALEKNGVPLAMGALFRKDAVDLGLVVKEVSGAYDFWIACLLAASGKAAYYVPARLTKYRVHEAMETKRMAPDKQDNLVYIYRSLLAQNLFPSKTATLTKFYGQVLRNVGKDHLRFGHRDKAREYFRQSLAACRDAKTVVWWLLSYVPRRRLAK